MTGNETISTPLIVAKSIKIQRGKGENTKLILNGSPRCTFTIASGQFTYLAGPSGVGKSTLLWTLARLHPLISGTLKFNGHSYTTLSVAHWRTEIALLSQKPIMIPGSVADNLLYPFHHFHIQKKRLHERHESLPKVEQLQQELHNIGLHDISLEREAISLSGGQQARLALIRLLLTQPKLILADEPTAGVDKAAAELVFNRLQQFCEQGGGVLLTSHVYGESVNGAKIVLKGNAELSKI